MYSINIIYIYIYTIYPANASIIPKPDVLGAFSGDSLTQLHFGVTSAEVAVICPDIYIHIYWMWPPHSNSGK